MYRFISSALLAALIGFPTFVQAESGWLQASRSLNVAKPCAPDASCAYTWTLASRMGHILRFVEARYGSRDRDWTLLGVEFTSADHPQVWYPTFDGIGDAIIIQLTESAAQNETQALFQLSHEVVHLLSPAGPGAKASVLEEGLATYNSLDYLAAIGKAVGPDYINEPRYKRAYLAVLRLAQRADFASGIRKLRARHGTLSALNPIDLQRVWPGLNGVEARALTAQFWHKD